MAFILGAYGKLMAGQLCRDLQRQQMRVQSDLRRVTKQIAQMDKMFKSQQRSMENALRGQMMMQKQFMNMNTSSMQAMIKPSINDFDQKAVDKYSNYQMAKMYADLKQPSAEDTAALADYNKMMEKVKKSLGMDPQKYIDQYNEEAIKDMKEASESAQSRINSANTEAQAALTMFQSNMQNEQANAAMQQQMIQAQIQDYFETQREMLLEPLNDLEADLQAEKDNLESRYAIAQAEYEAQKKQEQAGAKDMASNYNYGQG